MIKCSADIQKSDLIENQSILSLSSQKKDIVTNRFIFKIGEHNFDCLYIPNKSNSEKVFIFFSAGGRNNNSVRFQSWSWCKHLEADVLCIEDPTYKDLLSPNTKRQLTGWYFGNAETSYIFLMRDIVAHLQNIIFPKKKIIFTGTSAGGYAALFMASLCPNTYAIACNPQIDITKWNQYSWYPEIHELQNCDRFKRFDISDTINNSIDSHFLIYHNSLNEQDNWQVSHCFGQKIGSGVYSHNNALYLTSCCLYLPTHATFYSAKNISLFSDLLFSFSDSNKVNFNIKNKAENLIDLVTYEFEKKYQEHIEDLFKLIVNALFDSDIHGIYVNRTRDHINVLLRPFTSDIRFDIFIADCLEQRVIYGIHINIDLVDENLKDFLLSLTKRFNLRFNSNAQLAKFVKESIGYHAGANDFIDLIRSTAKILKVKILSDKKFNPILKC